MISKQICYFKIEIQNAPILKMLKLFLLETVKINCHNI